MNKKIKMIGMSVLLTMTTGLKAQISTFKITDEENLDVTSQLVNNQRIDTLILEDGSKLKIGDTLIFGKPFNGNKEYQNIIFGRYNIAKAVLLGPPSHMPDGWNGSKVVITDMFFIHTKLSSNSPVFVWLYVKDYKVANSINNRTMWMLQQAFKNGEIINPKASMTREVAIAKLKEKKDLLDLGIITQDEFNKSKQELTSIIVK